MDSNPGSAPTGQPPQGGSFGMPPQPQAPQVPLPPQPPIPGRTQSPIAVKPAWQVEVMQKVWASQGGSSVSNVQPAQQGAGNSVQPSQGQPMQHPALQQPYVSPGAAQPLSPSAAMPQVQSPATTGQMPMSAAPPAQPPFAPNATTPNPYAQSGKSSSKLWLVMIVFLLLLAAGGAALVYLMTQGGKTADSQTTLSQALATTFKTQTYNETLTTKTNDQTTTRTRIADFRKVGEPHVYIDNIAPANDKNTAQLTVVGSDYFVRKHFTKETIEAAREGTKAQMTKVNDQWVQVIKEGKTVDDTAVTDLIDADVLRAQRVVVPSPLLIGYFRDNEQQQLNSFIADNHVYSTSDTPPAEEQIDGQTAQHFKVAVNADKVRELNGKAAQMLGYKDQKVVETALKDAVPEQMDIWARKSDHRVLKYSYQKGETTYTYTYDKIDEAQEISAPHVAGEVPEGATASDDDVKEAVNTLFNGLNDYHTLGNNLPNDAQSFDEFLTQKIDSSLHNRFIVQFKSGTPEKGYIFYQNSSFCNSDHDAISPTDEPGGNFALLTRLSDSLYCVDNTE